LINLLGKLKNNYFQVSLGAVLLPVLAMSMCNKSTATPSEPKVTGPAAAVATSSFEGEGKVISTNPKQPSIEIDHREIKGLMPAMTMEFYVKDKSMLDGLKAGDYIDFTINNGVGGIVITRIKKRG
jgi:Cu/Ag efflux protein CusF